MASASKRACSSKAGHADNPAQHQRGYGERVQKSVFEAHLDERGYADLRKRLARLMKAEEDNVRFYRLCADCRLTIETVGRVGVTPAPGLTIV